MKTDHSTPAQDVTQDWSHQICRRVFKRRRFRPVHPNFASVPVHRKSNPVAINEFIKSSVADCPNSQSWVALLVAVGTHVEKIGGRMDETMSSQEILLDPEVQVCFFHLTTWGCAGYQDTGCDSQLIGNLAYGQESLKGLYYTSYRILTAQTICLPRPRVLSQPHGVARWFPGMIQFKIAMSAASADSQNTVSFQLPSNCLGADLVWWRESQALHTLVTIYGVIEELNSLPPGSVDSISLECALFTETGEFHSSWRESLPRNGMVVIDSAKHSGTPSSGLLATFPCVEVKNPGSEKYHRLYSMVDWYSDGGEIASLHNDQSLDPRTQNADFTEIVVLETAEQKNSLIVLNGLDEQTPRSITLHAKNHKGEIRSALYEPAMAPFSVQRLQLSNLFPGLAEFGDGRHIAIEGRFTCRGLYIRPYIFTEGRSVNAYHGGDKYTWAAIPDFVNRYLGRGEVNPMVALHQSGLTTTVNLLNSHGNLEDDFWVDARLYDRAGRLVAHRDRWLLARRNAVTRGDIADLLPDPRADFTGHIALNFSADEKLFYPRRLQALLEYRTAVSTARVMAWSDVWNGRGKLRELKRKLGPLGLLDKIFSKHYTAPPGATYRCHYRIWFKPPIVSHISITNCGIDPNYSQQATYVLRL